MNEIMMDDADLFVQIVKSQGLAAAARRLGLPPATVTRRLKRFEAAIGAQLIHRSARKFALTSEGAACFEALGGAIEQVHQALHGLDQHMHQLRGPLTVAAPTNVSVHLLRPMWAGFLRSHPKIQLDLRLSNRFEDLISEGVDLALRIGPQPDSAMMQKKLGRSAAILVAAPDYLALHGAPETPEDLNDHRILSIRVLPQWHLTHRATGDQKLLPLSASAAFDDLAMAMAMACDGLGIALLPVAEVSENLGSGLLVQVLPDWRGPERDVFAVWPTGRLLSARAAALRDEMVRFCRAEPLLQGQVPTAQVCDKM